MRRAVGIAIAGVVVAGAAGGYLGLSRESKQAERQYDPADGGADAAASDARGDVSDARAPSQPETPAQTALRHAISLDKCVSPDGGAGRGRFGARLWVSSDSVPVVRMQTWGHVEEAVGACLREKSPEASADVAKEGAAGLVFDVTITEGPGVRARIADFEMWATGDFYEEEVTQAQRDGEWLALCKKGRRAGSDKGGDYILVPTRVRAQEIVRDGPGYKISSPDCKGANVPLFRGLDQLRAALAGAGSSADGGLDAGVDAGGTSPTTPEVTSARLPAKRGIDSDQGVEVSFGGKRYRLYRSDINETASSLVLDQGKTAQILEHQEDSDYVGYTLSWAGDMDGDGKLDVLIRGYWGQLLLFLSTDAEPSFVRLAYTLNKMGC